MGYLNLNNFNNQSYRIKTDGSVRNSNNNLENIFVNRKNFQNNSYLPNSTTVKKSIELQNLFSPIFS